MNLDHITQRYLELFPGDFSGNTRQRQTPDVLFSTVELMKFSEPELLIFNEALSQEIGLGTIENQADLDFLNAAAVPDTMRTFATAYAGHQFGNWAGQLGDGRAIFAGEIRNQAGETTELQWKGAGATPYSRHADGRAVLRSTVREYLMSEAMHHLGIPTTRSLSMSLSGEQVERDILYNGNAAYEKGAVMMRTAPSFLRFGHFELVSAQRNYTLLQQLADFVIEHYYPEVQETGEQRYAELFRAISKRTSSLIVEWYRVGFVHGVMNTDNMSALGLTIDYGPFSFLDEFDLNFTSNTTDLPGRRYAFGNQAKVAQWNLWQLANALFPLIKDEKLLEQLLDDFNGDFWQKHDEMMSRKFGFDELREGDEDLFTEAQQLMQDQKMDYTLFFTQLEILTEETNASVHFKDTFYHAPDSLAKDRLHQFATKYLTRLQQNTCTAAESKAKMAATNPKFVLRNYLLFECIEQLNKGNKEMLTQLADAIQHPYENRYPEWLVKRPSKYDDKPGCSALSCSS